MAAVSHRVSLRDATDTTGSPVRSRFTSVKDDDGYDVVEGDNESRSVNDYGSLLTASPRHSSTDGGRRGTSVSSVSKHRTSDPSAGDNNIIINNNNNNNSPQNHHRHHRQSSTNDNSGASNVPRDQQILAELEETKRQLQLRDKQLAKMHEKVTETQSALNQIALSKARGLHVVSKFG